MEMRIDLLKVFERILLSRHTEILPPVYCRCIIYTMAILSLLKLVVWTFILFLALSFFGISIQAIVNSPVGQANLTYLYDLLSHLWLWLTEWIRPMP